MEQLFLLFSTLTLVTGVMVVLSLNPIHSVFWLTLTFVSAATLFLTLNTDFLGLMLIIVYVGAIAILFLFVIMMLDVLKFGETSDISHLLPLALAIGTGFFSNLWWLNKSRLFSFSFGHREWDFFHETNVRVLGKVLYTDFWLPFLTASAVLLVAMVGAIVLTHELGKETKRQSLSDQHQRNDSWT